MWKISSAALSRWRSRTPPDRPPAQAKRRRPAAAAGAAVQKALSRATVVNERSAKEIADILTSSDPAVSKRILAELQALAVKDKRVERNLNRARYLIRNAGMTDTRVETQRALAE